MQLITIVASTLSKREDKVRHFAQAVANIFHSFFSGVM
jgi:hypothetical protein